jgi:hypothetical protein
VPTHQESALGKALDASAEGAAIRDYALAFLRSHPKSAFWHPYGFVKLPVTSDPARRLSVHIWHPRVRRLQLPAHLCHSHGWLLESTVLAGSLIDRRYEVTPSALGDAFIYQVAYEGDDSVARRTMERVKTRLLGEASVPIGARYVIPREEFHTTVTRRGTAVTAIRNVEDPVVPGRTVRLSSDPEVLRYRRGSLSQVNRDEVVADAIAAIEAAV